MEPAGNVYRSRGLLRYLLGDGKDGSLGLSNGLLRPADGDGGIVLVVGSLVDVDLHTGGVLDVVDGRTRLAENTRNRASRNGELDDVVRFLLELDGLQDTVSYM